MIRSMLVAGDLASANMLLGVPYTLYGKVVHGAGLGTGLGFPTANLCLDDPHQLIPKHGVYLSKVIWQGKVLFGLTNIGVSPTLKKDTKTEVETYIMDLSADFTDTEMALELLAYMREEILFANRDELICAMRNDELIARRMIAGERI